MKRIVTEMIDGLEVVTAVKPASIDPISTMRKVSEELAKTQEFKELREAAVDYQSKYEAYITAKSAIETDAAKNKKDPDYTPIQGLWDEMQSANAVCRQKAEALHELKKQLEMLHVVYFNTKASEQLEEDHIAENIQASLGRPQQAVLKDGSTVPDHRGRAFWKKDGKNWILTQIVKLNEEPPESAIATESLSEEQLEEIQIQNMSSSDRALKKKMLLDGLKTRAAMKYAEYDFDGEPDAKQKALDWLADEQAIVEAKFGNGK